MKLTIRPHLYPALLATAVSHASCSAIPPYPSSTLLVQNDIFAVQGTVWPNNSAVHFFGNIPYAEPPVQALRFQPPVTKSPSAAVINGSWFGPSCIQYSNGQPTVYSEYLRGFLISPGQSQSEDCLTLNVWAPASAKAGDALPVMIWIHGGAHTSGGAASPYKYGDRLAADQNVIVVAINYRLNIFGYPGASALQGRDLNPGLLDQRKAVEWTHANIQAFGGDPEQMTLFGQSAGGSSVDMYTYAHPSDPLVKGFIAQSGVALDAPESDGTNFTYVAEQVGCGTPDGRETDAKAELECMQQAPATAIIEVYNNYNATLNAGKPLSFSTVADNRTRFSNYSDRRSQGLFARVPIIYSTANNEGATLVPYTGPEGTNQTAVDIYTTTRFSCPGDEAAAAKAASGVPVWRLRYFGEWPNLNPLAWLGAYHSSDMPMVFGTSDRAGADTELEAKTSAYMQGAWAAFARDPATGLSRSEGAYGWPRYQSEEKTLVQLGLEGTSEAVLATGDAFACRS